MHEEIKVGGQALADGVLMRTSRAWAIARADGSVEVGAVASNPFAKVPVLRIVAALFSALRLGIAKGFAGRKGNTKLNRRLLLIFVGLEAAALAFSQTTGDLAATTPAILATTVITFAVLRIATPPSLWRYHGAEHKAVSAHEQGVDLADTAAVLKADRVHNRCGTNLVFVVLLGGLAVRDVAHGLWEIPAFLLLIGVAAELVTLASQRPGNPVSQVVLAGGKALQRWVTTAEPTAAEQAVATTALTAAIEAHARIVALDDAPLPSVAAAAA